MREVNDSEAKAQLAELLSEVENGDTVRIMRNGKTVAQLSPAEPDEPDDPEAAHAARMRAIERFKRERATWRRTGITREEILEWIGEGRRSTARFAGRR